MKTYKVEIDDYGTSCWYFSDKLHREDGPACEFADGTKYFAARQLKAESQSSWILNFA